jgi:beta-lactamase superfamily II metal-dependent hydrolase
MEITIFNVEHGFCGYLVADNRNVMLIDCGHNATTGFYPANYLAARGCTGIERFFVTNYDEDHLSGLPMLLAMGAQIPIQILSRNPSITADQLRQLKSQSGPLGPGLTALLSMIARYTEDVTAPPLYPNIEYSLFWNRYPAFQDTNNLSLVLFIHYPAISIVFTGDLEKPGWQALLRDTAFRQHLAKVNIFVASHHGRESGYLPEVFQVCTPDVIIISDEAVQYQTQQVPYSTHARGIRWNQTDTRRVLSTRNDGMLTISSTQGGYHIQATR